MLGPVTEFLRMSTKRPTPQQQAAAQAAALVEQLGTMTALCLESEWELARQQGWKVAERAAEFLAFTARQRNRSARRRARLMPVVALPVDEREAAQ
jgi:hypothetical protein